MTHFHTPVKPDRDSLVTSHATRFYVYVRAQTVNTVTNGILNLSKIITQKVAHASLEITTSWQWGNKVDEVKVEDDEDDDDGQWPHTASG